MKSVLEIEWQDGDKYSLDIWDAEGRIERLARALFEAVPHTEELKAVKLYHTSVEKREVYLGPGGDQQGRNVGK